MSSEATIGKVRLCRGVALAIAFVFIITAFAGLSSPAAAIAQDVKVTITHVKQLDEVDSSNNDADFYWVITLNGESKKSDIYKNQRQVDFPSGWSRTWTVPSGQTYELKIELRDDDSTILHPDTWDVCDISKRVGGKQPAIMSYKVDSNSWDGDDSSGEGSGAGYVSGTELPDGTTGTTGSQDQDDCELNFWVTKSVHPNIGPFPEIKSISPNPANEGVAVTFVGEATDIDGTVTSVAWYCDGGFLSSAYQFQKSDLTVGVHEIVFSAVDNDGAVSVTGNPWELTVEGNHPPAVTISSISPNPANMGQTVHFAGTASDSDGDSMVLTWSSNLDGYVGSGADAYVPASELSDGDHIISFRAIDEHGATGTQTWPTPLKINQPGLVDQSGQVFRFTDATIGTPVSPDNGDYEKELQSVTNKYAGAFSYSTPIVIGYVNTHTATASVSKAVRAVDQGTYTTSIAGHYSGGVVQMYSGGHQILFTARVIDLDDGGLVVAEEVLCDYNPAGSGSEVDEDFTTTLSWYATANRNYGIGVYVKAWTSATFVYTPNGFKPQSALADAWNENADPAGEGITFTEIQVWADTNPELWSKYDESSGTAGDSSGQGHTGTLYGVEFRTGGVSGNCIYSDGTYDDRVDYGDVASITGDITVTCWVKTTSTRGLQFLVAKAPNTGYHRTYELHIGYDSATQKYTIEFVRGRSDQTNYLAYIRYSTAFSATDNLWHFIAARHSPTTGSYGISVDSGPWQGTLVAGTGIGTVYSDTSSLQVGNLGSGISASDRSLQGYIDDVRIWDRYLADSEFNQPPVASFTATASGLTVNVDGSASWDSDGTISMYTWNWGDGATSASSASTSSHTYTAYGTYTVQLTVTDDDGARRLTTKSVPVVAPGNFVLTVSTSSSTRGTTSPAPGTYTYSANTYSASFSANAKSGYYWDYWLLDGDKVYDWPISVYMDSDHALVAHFSRIGGGCVAEGTVVIMADYSTRTIEDIKVGDWVLGYDPVSGSYVQEQVLDTHKTLQTAILSINDGALRVTLMDQNIWVRTGTSEGWILNPVELQIGWEIFDVISGEWVTIASLEVIEGKAWVYDITTDGPQTYIADSFLVKDKPIEP